MFVSVFLLTSLAPIFSLPIDVARETYEFPFVTREEWNARPSTDIRPLEKPVPYVIIHHTYIPEACYDKEACSRSMRGMQNSHNDLGWGDIGYNFCVGSDGAVYEGRGWDIVGIHARTANNFSVGICLIGDWQVELPPRQQLETTKSLIAVGVELGVIREDYKLVGHSSVVETICPGGALFQEISTWDHFTPREPTDPIP